MIGPIEIPLKVNPLSYFTFFFLTIENLELIRFHTMDPTGCMQINNIINLIHNASI